MTGFPQQHAVVFDLEFTSWEGSLASRWLKPGEYTELVQVGAVKIDTGKMEIVDSLQLLVRPRINRDISPYLEKLTGISNDRLAREGVDFTEAYGRFLAFAGGAPIVAFGRDDLIFETNIRLYGLTDLAPLPRYTNVVPWLIEQGLDPRGRHACDVGPMAGVPFEGQTHDALNDARSVALGILALMKKGARNIFEDAA